MTPQKNNSMLRQIFIGAIVLIILGWIGWVSGSIQIGTKERALACQERLMAEQQRLYMAENIMEIKKGIRNLTDYFMVPKPSSKKSDGS